MNLFPVYKQKDDTATVKKGKFYSTLYVVGFLVTLIVWIVVVSLPGEGRGYVSKIYPENYDPSNEDVIPVEEITALQNDVKKKNVKCICSNTDPTFSTFADVTYQQYEFCNILHERYDYGRCRGHASVGVASAKGDLCPGGLTMDEFNFENNFLRIGSQGAYAINHFKTLCYTSLITLIGLRKGVLSKTVASPTFTTKARLQKLLDTDMESALIVQIGAMYSSMGLSFGNGRFNMPFKTMKVRASRDSFEDLGGRKLYIHLYYQQLWLTVLPFLHVTTNRVVHIMLFQSKILFLVFTLILRVETNTRQQCT